jgi:hypothetical protein
MTTTDITTAAASVLAVENEIEAWKKAAALVRRVAGEVKP